MPSHDPYHVQCHCGSSSHNGYKSRQLRRNRVGGRWITLNPPCRICLHKGFPARHGRPPSGGEASPSRELDPLRRDTLTGHGERLDTHPRPPCPLQDSVTALDFFVKDPSTHHVVDALSKKFPLTTFGIPPILVRGINDQVTFFKIGIKPIDNSVANGTMREREDEDFWRIQVLA